MIILIIGWMTSIVFEIQCRKWKNKHDEAVVMCTIKSRRKDEQIEKLENELKTYKDREKVIKFERIIMQPKEYECRFAMTKRFIYDNEEFKKICLREVARYLAEELEKDGTTYKVFFKKAPLLDTVDVKIKFRLLPYPEEATWNDILKEELRGDIYDKRRIPKTTT